MSIQNAVMSILKYKFDYEIIYFAENSEGVG